MNIHTQSVGPFRGKIMQDSQRYHLFPRSLDPRKPRCCNIDWGEMSPSGMIHLDEMLRLFHFDEFSSFSVVGSYTQSRPEWDPAAHQSYGSEHDKITRYVFSRLHPSAKR